ncbi:polyphenol oxidase, chloroplastic [Beta vulgaris subsp. vulgaris]|uniref:polyphenol oxidase, chloroplastic n=1 Tax=Beta vulgaris subsp. vulgaris TaxID=3555 RepID=UPI0025482E07|nr:polyphenol oxidase, chloroplastic [Beta vulgaris subsp. vulgaris]
MASLSPSTTTTTTQNLSAVPRNALLSKSSQLSAFRSTQSRRGPAKISCNAANNNESNKFDRRNLLIGLGGLYGAATTLTGGNATLAAPTAPDATQCAPSTIDDGSTLLCCPPKPSQFVDFKLPTVNPKQLRLRPAAHLVDEQYLAKYSRALALMKALPDSDPRSFKNQANVHCAYCNGGYHQVGLPNIEFQVHGSWLFFPFHRAYLYFYERILAKLIDDPTFSLPYWNWDHPDGMYMPSMFDVEASPFYDAIRDQNHRPPTLMNLSYDGPDTVSNLTKEEQIAQNLAVMYKQMVANAKKPELFLGGPYRAGDPPGSTPGTLEVQPHGTIHNWTGNPPPNTPFWEDMGNFYSAGRDPIFYSHHANVDRTWSIWKSLSTTNKDFTDTDFLDSHFYFYDENAQPVKIYVRDVLDTKKLGYDYQPQDLPWLQSKPTPKRNRRPKPLKKVFSTVKNAVAAEPATDPVVPTVVFPKPLKNIIRTNLPRPRKSRTQNEKDDEEEILVIEVESRADVYSKFDVYVNDEDESPTLENRTQTEYAGSFVNVPHRHGGKDGHLKKTTVKFGLSELIDDLDANDDEGIDIIFVPRTGTDSVIIKDVRIEFQD